MSALHRKSMAELAELLARRAISPVALTEALLERIEALDPHLRAFTALHVDIGLREAREAEKEIAAGRYRGPLHGIPYALKDIIDYEGVPTTANSRVLLENVASQDAEVTRRLKQAGAVFLGKLTTNEFACGGPAIGCPYPQPLNPWNAAAITAGSSSGSAVALAAQLVPLALGTDTNGSIRNPGSRCGIVGLKPTYGRVSRRGVFPLSPSLDHVGPMTRTVRDNALALAVLAGHDARDPGSRDTPVPDLLAKLDAGVEGLRIGYVRHLHAEDPGADPEQIHALDQAVESLREAGANVIELELGHLEQYTAVARVFLSAEGYAIHEAWLRASPELYGKGCKGRLLQGAFLSARDLVQAQRLRRRLIDQLVDLMSDVDVMITASCYDATPRVDDLAAARNRHAHQVLMPFNVTGSPALVLPTGLSRTTGLPLSMQIVGHPFDEAMVYRVARAVEIVGEDLSERLPCSSPFEI